ncbi:MAG: haloalkane dehalogenase [Myxococcota bacterium]
MKTIRWAMTAALVTALMGCDSDSDNEQACNAEPEVLVTAAGVEFVRTPDSCFEDLPDWDYAAEYVEIDGLRQAYVDEGPQDGPVVLLLHGQPSWSYLYRKMIPGLTNAGYRVIAMDHVGMGRSDKPTSLDYYSYVGHADRLQRFIEELDLRDINLFVQDWGATIGLRVAGRDTDRYATISVGNGQLPVIPAGTEIDTTVENRDQIEDIPNPYASVPAQQVPFYDGCDRIDDGNTYTSFDWAVKGESFQPSVVLEALTWFDLPAEVEAAYNAPFPSRDYMAGTRIFSSLRGEFPGLNQDAQANLTSFDRPVLTIWGSNDPKEPGACQVQDGFVCDIPGAQAQAHVRLSEASHFLQDDQGEEIAERLVAFWRGETQAAEYQTNCETGSGLPVTADGTGTVCATDADCADLEASACLTDLTAVGFCTIEMCEPNGCGEAYECCGDCNPSLASQLPFDTSACLPAAAADQLEAGAGCTCD